MTIEKGNLFNAISEFLSDGEAFEDLLTERGVRIERIVSSGHATPEGEWYDQDKDEWVLVVQGQAVVAFADGQSFKLEAGDYLYIPAQVRHRVEWTQPEEKTIWLAIHF